MTTFKVGDRARRLRAPWCGMGVGDVGTVSAVRPADGALQFKEDHFMVPNPPSSAPRGAVWHCNDGFELVARTERTLPTQKATDAAVLEKRSIQWVAAWLALHSHDKLVAEARKELKAKGFTDGEIKAGFALWWDQS